MPMPIYRITERDYLLCGSVREARTKVRQTISSAMKLTAMLGAAIV